MHVGKGQIRIACGSQKVHAVLEDREVPEYVKEKIRLVLEAKSFGEKQLGLTSSKNYTRYYYVKTPPVAYNLTACPKLVLEAYRWCFPIVGCLPYKGFFEREPAVRESNRMVERGYDIYLRPVAAYSTLGWFTDPIFSTMLEYEETTLVELILHEMVHRTIFVKDQGAFNEGVATFVGERGTEAFFQTMRKADAEFMETIREKQMTKRLFRETMLGMADKLGLLYGSDMEEAEKLVRREQIFAEGKESLQRKLEGLGSTRYQGTLRTEWNNAFVVSYLTYHKDPDLWELVYDRFDRDLTAMVAWLKELDKEKDPLSCIERWLTQAEVAASH